MRWCFASALGVALAVSGLWYWASGQAQGVEFVSKTAAVGPEGNAHFGGLSGYEVDGGVTYFLTDRGWLYTATESGLSGVKLKQANGTPLSGKLRDSEGLAAVGEGLVAVSFEGEHRVALYDASNGSLLRELPDFEGLAELQGNSGLEALAVSPDAELLAIPERSGASTRPFSVFIFDGETWRATNIPRRGKFLPVGADFGPDGRLYLLERDYLLGGFRSRIRRFDWAEEQLSGEEVLLKTRFGRHGNLEGIAVFDEGGGRFIEMVSDNNFLPVQASEIVRYRIVTP